MRKTLLIAAAALASSVISSQAQVYSQNIVGYINVPLVTGYTALANQLDYDGTGTNNTVATVFGTNLVAGTTVLAWEAASASYVSANWILSRGALQWANKTNAISAALNAGQGVFVQSPSTNNLTLVGTVLQGTNLLSLVTGYNFVSSVAPISGDLVTNLGYTPSVGDNILLWNNTTQSYKEYSYINSRGTSVWSPSVPQISVGQSFFIQAAAAETWTNSFVE
ncbi:MAG: hypothetical protein P4L95_21760 [Rouxiella aceris]|uniref:hypothetical protein n=1 Tax=Rouxiella aceris TaxID=2703884 RepID=UPI002846A6CD|nr:hypothetical protein [Rouxiella aceris]MDR3434491.1 hypothetical protein [Rouxiella aceris]